MTVSTAACWGVVAGWWTPRGPLSTGEAIWSIVLSLGVGVAGGLVLRSRWAALVMPVVFAGAFELVRRRTNGPLVDGVSTSEYGLVAFGTGRGFHASLSLFPMVFGSLIGAGVSRRAGQQAGRAVASPRVWMYVRRGVAGLAAVGLVGFTAMLARPASTNAIVDASCKAVAGSVAELTTVKSNGHKLAMMIRGHRTDNPVILFLAGGPGGSEMGAMRKHLQNSKSTSPSSHWTSGERASPTSNSTLRTPIPSLRQLPTPLRSRTISATDSSKNVCI